MKRGSPAVFIRLDPVTHDRIMQLAGKRPVAAVVRELVVEALAARSTSSAARAVVADGVFEPSAMLDETFPAERPLEWPSALIRWVDQRVPMTRETRAQLYAQVDWRAAPAEVAAKLRMLLARLAGLCVLLAVVGCGSAAEAPTLTPTATPTLEELRVLADSDPRLLDFERMTVQEAREAWRARRGGQP
jgi:hypothetical protein